MGFADLTECERRLTRLHRRQRRKILIVLIVLAVAIATATIIQASNRGPAESPREACPPLTPATRPALSIAQPVAPIPAVGNSGRIVHATAGGGNGAVTFPATIQPAATSERADREPPPAPVKSSRVQRMRVTAYCPCSICCGRWALVPDERRTFADGSRFDRHARVAAVDTAVIPFGSTLEIPGYGRAVAHDRGGAIRGNHIDLLFSMHVEARAWGVQDLDVEVRP